MGNWTKFFGLPSADRQLLMEAAIRLIVAWCVLRLVSFARVTATLERARTGRRAVTPETVRRIRWAVESAARNLPLSLTCLPQALAVSWMLITRGCTPQMLYGVAKVENGGFESHAWVELDGQPVIGHREAPRFTVLTSFPPPTATL